MRLALIALAALAVTGCEAPEDGRAAERGQFHIATPEGGFPEGTDPDDPDAQLVVTLTWGEGSADFDLHLLKLEPDATFGAAPWDCFYSNAGPDWPPLDGAGNGLEDPKASPDHTDGPGPEDVRILQPEPGDYEILVHFYDGAAPTTGNVLVSGTLAAESTMTLSSSGSLWRVGAVHWPNNIVLDGTIEILDPV